MKGKAMSKEDQLIVDVLGDVNAERLLRGMEPIPDPRVNMKRAAVGLPPLPERLAPEDSGVVRFNQMFRRS